MVSYSPWLMVPNQHHSEDRHRTESSISSGLGWWTCFANSICGEVEEKHIKRSFLNVSTNQVHTLELPEDACGKRKTICGFSLGWLILFDNRNSSLTLLNPFIGDQINNLPRLPRKGTVHKAVLSADPSCNPNGYKVLAIFGDKRELIGYEQGKKQWTMLQDYGNHYDDVLVQTDEAFIAVSELGKLVCCDPPACNEHVPASFFKGKKVYLVSINGDVFMLVSFSGTSYCFWHETYDDKLKRFEVYRYDEGRWCHTKNLHEFTIFLGQNHSVAVRNAPDFRPDCIYFTDDDEGKVENSGVFSLKEGEAERMQWFMPRLS
ncbi:F-box/kelch-repeat protein [Rosa sericea]